MNKSYYLACGTYIADGWYGSNVRYIIGPFPTKKAAWSKASIFKKFLKKEEKVSAPMLKVAEYTDDNFPTYIYCGAGPSYSCTNVDITEAQLEEFQTKLEREKLYN